MELDAPIRIVPNAVQDVDDRSDLDVEARLLANLPPNRRFQRLADVDRPAGHAPLALERLVCAFHQQHAVAIEHNRAHADDGPLGADPQIPITFTTTRFFRCPSNSA